MTTFKGFGPEAQTWFAGLEVNNSKEYFAARRDFFEESIRDQMAALLNELSEKFGGEVKMFRQNRDIRFSPDKSPYKTNTYGVLYGADIAAQGLYASISARGLVAGGGYHLMARDQLDRYRESVADDEPGAELSKLTAKAESRTRALGREPRDRPARLSEGPPADRAPPAQEPLARRYRGVRLRDRSGRRAEVRHEDVARGGARDRLARPARRADGTAGRAAAEPTPTLTPQGLTASRSRVDNQRDRGCLSTSSPSKSCRTSSGLA